MVTDYDGLTEQVTVTALTPGSVYRFHYIATNFHGDSVASAILSAAASILPDPPGSPLIDWAKSSKTGLHLDWLANSTGTLPTASILGYLLQMDSGNGTYVTVYDGSFLPGTLGVLVDGLTNGALYNFQVIAVNYNGQSAPSSSTSYYACTAPTLFAAPTIVS